VTALADRATVALLGGTAALLVLASAVGWALERRITSEPGRATVRNLNARIRAWWVMVLVFAGALLAGPRGTLVLFGLTSFLALREFITLSPTRPADHRSLFWTFFLVTPLQYVLLGVAWYGFFTVLIPVYAFLLIPTLNALAGDPGGFLERTAKIQWGLMVCVYALSHAPALLILDLPGRQGQGGKLLFFLVAVVQLSDVLQYVWGKLAGRRKIAPVISPQKTWEGFLGGVLCATGLGTALYWATPFTPGQAAGFSLVITLMGFAGGLTMSAIKRDRGVKDYGELIPGHGGVLDRIDSLCFAAPVFFHLVRYSFA
jgi:phosphatidate cytidylyltransferase